MYTRNRLFANPSLANIGLSIRTLLNGECGSLDCGTLYSVISDTLKENGFERLITNMRPLQSRR